MHHGGMRPENKGAMVFPDSWPPQAGTPDLAVFCILVVCWDPWEQQSAGGGYKSGKRAQPPTRSPGGPPLKTSLDVGQGPTSSSVTQGKGECGRLRKMWGRGSLARTQKLPEGRHCALSTCMPI